MQHDPFGKPGHGAPMKTDSGTLITSHARTLTKNQYEMREVEHKQYRRASIGKLYALYQIGEHCGLMYVIHLVSMYL